MIRVYTKSRAMTKNSVRVGTVPEMRLVAPSRWARTRDSRVALPTLSLIVFLAVWEIGSLIIGRAILLPTPDSVARSFVRLVWEGTMGGAFARAIAVMFSGFTVAAVLGIAWGLAMGRSVAIYKISNPYVAFFQSTPQVALIPIIIIWFGIGYEAGIFVTFLHAIWSIVINTCEGVRTTPVELHEMARVYRASRREMARSVILPHAIPYIFAGLRIGFSRALVGVIIAEMTISLLGLGGLIVNFGQLFRTADMLAAVLAAALVGVIGDSILRILRRRMSPWEFD